MEFWNAHMPKGMFLRSGADWHLDPLDVHTFTAFLEAKGLKKKDVDPIPVELYREYGLWFANSCGLRIAPFMVRELGRGAHGFEATLDDGTCILAQNVLLVPGFRHFMNVPEGLASIIPGHRCSHTCELVEFDFLRGKRCLIVGGRQSAFEWAALIAEKGAKELHLVYRHDTPRFEASDWTWVNPMMDLTFNIRGWYRRLPANERSAIEQRFWAEGRLKLEPWLAPRINKDPIHLWPHCSLDACQEVDDGSMAAHLSSGQVLAVDHAVLATGYRVNIECVPYLSQKSILSVIRVNDGVPILDEDFQSSIPGLYMAGLVATKDFGPFYGFVRGCPTAARIIVNRIADRQRG
jgi:thioredoxin reductase